MTEKRRRRASPSDGLGVPPKQVAPQSRSAVRCGPGYGSLLGPEGRRKAAGSCGLGRPIAGSQTHTAYVGCPGAKNLDHPSSTQTTQCVGRVRSGRHSSRIAIPRHLALPHRADDWPHPSAERRSGWPETCSASGTTSGLVSAEVGGRKGRIGQFRHDRGPRDPRSIGCDHFDRNFAAWRFASRLARKVDQQPNGRPIAGGALARGGTSCLLPVRQRQPVLRPQAVRRRGRPCLAALHGAGCHPCVCASLRNWLPSGNREPQRPMAKSRMVAIRTPIASRAQGPLWKVRDSRTGEICHSYQSSSLAATVPQTMAVESAKTSAGHADLYPPHQRPGTSQYAGTSVPRRPQLGASARPIRCRAEGRKNPLLRPPETRTYRAALVENYPIQAPKETLQGVTNMFGYLPF